VWTAITATYAVLTYLIVNFILPGRVSADQYMYVHQPILWSSLAILAWLGWRYALDSRPVPAWSLAVTASLLALCQLALLFMTGLFLGFGYSPYSHQLSAILHNLLYLVTMLAGTEVLRAYLVARFPQQQLWIPFLVVSFFLAVLRTAPATFGQFDSLQSSIQLIGERLLPTLAQNMLATLLALLGGPLPSLLYLGILQLFQWLSPILPNPGWFVTAVVGTVIPAYGMVIVYNQFLAGPEMHEQTESHKDGSLVSWTVVAVFTLILVGFSTGLFGMHPSLIGSGSMTPNLLVGDIVVARAVPIETVRVGDVITFYQEGVTIVHRVIEVHQEGGQIILITQGDANDSPDPPVLPEYYKGKVVFTIPKIGWISIAVRNLVVKLRG
jgi:signal peptidase